MTGAAVTWLSTDKLLTVVIGISTVFCIWSNIVLNRAKRKQVEAETEKTKAETEHIEDSDG